MAFSYEFDQSPSEAQLKELISLFAKHAYWPMPAETAEWEKLLANTSLFIIARDGEKIIGFARLLTDFVRWAQIYDVLVHRDYQRRGVGRELVSQLVAHESILNVRNISLSTLSDRSEFYEAFGFRKLALIGNVESFSLVRNSVGLVMTKPLEK